MINLDWYANLNKPLLTPPDWIFSPTWIVLYITIFVSLIIFTTTVARKDKIKGYVLFILQLLLNILWTPVFFVFKNVGLAFMIIILLDVLVYFTIKSFYKVSRQAGIILLPYFVWILYATYLNAGICFLN